MEVTSVEKEFIKSIIIEDVTSAYVHFLNWQNRTNFKDNLSNSITIYLPFLYQRFKKELKENPYQNLYEGIYKKNILINSMAFEIVKQFSNHLRQHHIQHSFLGSLAISKLLNWENNIRRLNNIECLIESNKIKSCTEFLQGLGYELNEKNPRKTIFQINLSHVSYPKITIYLRPIKFHNKTINKKWYLATPEINLYNHPSAEKMFIQKAMNIVIETQWYPMVDCLLLINKYQLTIEQIEPFLTSAGIKQAYKETVKEASIEIFKQLEPKLNKEKNTFTFSKFLLKNNLDYQTKSIAGRLALQANNEGVLNQKIFNLIAWYKILKGVIKNESLFV